MLTPPYNFILYGFVIILMVTALVFFVVIVRTQLAGFKDTRQEMGIGVIVEDEEVGKYCGGEEGIGCEEDEECIYENGLPFSDGECVAVN